MARKKTQAYSEERNYNYWVSDGGGYRFQVLIYNLNNGFVSFRRSRDVTWPVSSFLVFKDGIKVVNPLITYAFKVTTKPVQEKDLFDISILLDWVKENA